LQVLISVANVADRDLIRDCAFRNPEVPLAVDACGNGRRMVRGWRAKPLLDLGSVPRFELFFSERHDNLQLG